MDSYFQETDPLKNKQIPNPGVNPLNHGRFSDPYFKVLWEMGKTKFLDFFSYGHPQQKSLQGQEFSGMGASR